MMIFDFHGIRVGVSGSAPETLGKLAKDFSFFLANKTPETSPGESKTLHLHLIAGSIPKDALPAGLDAVAQSFNSITYQTGAHRYNDYYGEALSIFDYSTESARIFAPSENRLHEIAYLLILSRVGKQLDRHGLARIHAFAVERSGTVLVGMMPMKGGKTTLFLDLLRDPATRPLSDDSPLVNGRGRILPFPIRVGCDATNGAHWLKTLPSEHIYSIDRKQYGEKSLIDIQAFSNGIGEDAGHRLVLFQGVRNSGNRCVVQRCSRIRMAGPLLKNMVVGLGLPMILEYFLEGGWRDGLRNTRILHRRLHAAAALLCRSETYRISFGSDRDENTRRVRELLR